MVLLSPSASREVEAGRMVPIELKEFWVSVSCGKSALAESDPFIDDISYCGFEAVIVVNISDCIVTVVDGIAVVFGSSDSFMLVCEVSSFFLKFSESLLFLIFPFDFNF